MKRTNKPQRPLRRRLSEQLEDRVLFDAEMAELFAIDPPHEDQVFGLPDLDIHLQPEEQTLNTNSHQTDSQSGSQRSQSKHVVFVDVTINDFEQLVEDIEQDILEPEIIYLDPNRDGFTQIGEALEQFSDLSAIHIVSHGTDGTLHLGNDLYRAEDLTDRYGATLQQIGQSLADDGDILIYGCDIANTNPGRELARVIAEATSADVAMSTDTTANLDRGGNWDLEYHYGSIESQTLWVTGTGTQWAGTLTPTPTVTLNLPTEEFINESFSFEVTFENTSATPSDAGYAPYIDLHVPAGIQINAANLYSGTLTPTVAGTYNASGDLTNGIGAVITHPITGLPSTGNPGDTLMIYQLPFGSFVPGQPDATVQFDAELSKADGAVVGTPLTITSTGFFALGATPADDPGTDPPIIGNSTTAMITPTVLELTKTSDAPEAERSTGPNYPITFTLTLDIANGETVENLVIEDFLPNSYVYVANSVNVTTSSSFSTTQPTAGSPQNAPNNRLAIDLGTVTGTTATEVVVTYQAWISEFDADGAPVLDPVSGNDVVATNDSRVVGTYNSALISDDDSATDTDVSQQSIATQKSVQIVNDLGGTGATPGDTLEYVINIQVSDYFEFADLVVNDVLSDGQLWDSSFSPTFVIREEGSVSSGTFAPTQHTVTHNAPGDGTTDVQFDIASILSDGVITGDLFDDLNLDGASTVEIRFRTIIQEDFAVDFPSGDRSVDTGDPISNTVTVTGRVLDGANNNQFESDGSGTTISITGPTVSKSVYAIDGDTSKSGDPIIAGHTITYRISFPMPTADYENLVLTDFLPLPIYDATEITGFLAGPASAVPPPAGFFSYGPAHTLDAVAPSTDPPSFSTDAATNSVQFNFGNFDVVNSGAETIEILFTVTAQDMRFADGLLLTNQANATYGLTTNASRSSNSIAQNLVASPELAITKGIVSTTGTTPTYQGSIGPAAFIPPGIAGKPFAGSITAADLAATPIDADIRNIDAKDRVKVAIAIENTGGADGFNLNLIDELHPDYVVPTAGLNVQVFRGDGTALSFTGDLFTTGIEITDPNADEGAINNQTDGAADGSNVIIVTYDIELRDSVEINQLYDTTVEITAYGTIDGGLNHATGLPNGALEDNASITVQNVAQGKSIVATSESHTGFSSGTERVAVGEIVRYQLVLEIPEGTSSDLIINERLRSGMQYLDDGTATVAFISDSGFTSLDGSAALALGLGTSGNVTGSATTTPTFVLPDVNVGSSSSLSVDSDSYGNGTNPQFKLGTVINNDNDANSEYVVIEFNALVLNRSNVNQNSLLRNDYQTSINPTNVSGRQTLGTSNQANVRVVEPRIDDLNITASQATADAGDTITFTITFTNDGSVSNSDAFDAVLTNSVPAGYTLNSPSINVSTSAGFGAISDNSTGNNLEIAFDQIPAGGTVTITYDATLGLGVQPDEILTSPVTLTYSSLPGNGTSSNATGSSTPGRSGDLTGERNDSGGVNDHIDTDSIIVRIVSPTLAKTLVSTSVTSTQNSSTELVIGETATYELRLQIPEGTTSSAVVYDNLAPGLSFSSLDSVTFDADITTDLTGSVTANTVGQQVEFDLGTLVNAASDAAAEEIVIHYTVIADNVAANQTSTTLSNSARLTWDLNGSARSTATDSVDVTVIEPDLELDFSASPNPVDAGDAVTFTLIVEHSSISETDAFDVFLSETLPAELGNVQIVSATHSSQGDLASAFTYSSTTNSVTTTAPNGFDLEFGDTLTLVLSADVNQIVNPLQTLTSDSTVVWTSLDGNSSGERSGTGGVNDYRFTSQTSLTVVQPSITKSLLSTGVTSANNSATQAVIGETVQYRIRVQVPESTIDNSRILDTLDNGLEFVSIDSVSVRSAGVVTAGVTSNGGPIVDESLFQPTVVGQDLIFDFGQIVNSDNANSNIETLEIIYTARVTNEVANQQGDTRGNEASFAWSHGASNRETATASAFDITIIEPSLGITHDISDATGDAYDAISISTLISHTPGSDTDAFDVTYQSVLPEDFVVSSFSATHSLLGDVTALFEVTAGNEFRTIAGQSFDVGLTESITIVANGNIDADVMPQDVLQSQANISWTSLDGSIGGERTGTDGLPTSGSTPLNNYLNTGATSFTVDSIQFAKRLVSTSITDSSNSNTDAVIGELVTYELTVTMPEGEADSVVVTDMMDLGLQFVSLDSAVFSSGLSSNLGSFAPTITGNGVNSPQTLQFDLGDLQNTNSNNTIPETLVLTYTARVTNIATNTSNGSSTGTILDESASLTYDHRGTPRTTPTLSAQNIEIIEPDLAVSISVDDDTPHLGQVIEFTTVVQHSASSDASAHDIVILDNMPTGLTLQSITVQGATVTANSSTPSSVSIVLDTLAVGDQATITYRARVTDDLNAIGDTLQNDPFITWTSIRDGGTTGATLERDGDLGNLGEDDYNDVDAETITIVHPLVEITQQTISTAPAASGTPGNFDITYDLVVTSTGNDPLTQINIDENFQSLFGTGFVNVVAAPIVIASTANDALEINPTYSGRTGNSSLIDLTGGDTNRLQPGESTTIRLTVEVDPNAAGAILNNGDFISQATVTAIGEGSSLSATDLSDDPDNLTESENDTVADFEPDDPNTHRFPVLSLTKRIVSSPVVATSGVVGNYDVTYEMVIRNDGSTPIERLSLEEDLQSHFGNAFVRILGTPSTTSTATDPPALNPLYSGSGPNTQIFDSSSSRLDINQTVIVTLVVEIDPNAIGGNRDAATGGLDNHASVTGFDPQQPTVPFVDLSDDPNDLTDIDANSDNDPDDPTRLLLQEIIVVKETIGVPVPASSGIDGNHEATFEITLTNHGNEPLESLSLIQDFQSDYGAAFVRVVGSPTIVAGGGTSDLPEINSAYNGRPGNNDLFDQAFIHSDRLNSGESVTVRLTIEFDPDAPGAIISNGDLVSQATGSGTGIVSSRPVSDASDDPVDLTERNTDGDLDPDDPNRLRLPIIAITKSVVGTPTPAASGTPGNFDVLYEFVVENNGSTALTNLSLIEDLQSQFGNAFVGIVGSPVLNASGLATPPTLNAAYLGSGTEINLLDSTVPSQLEVNEQFSVRLLIEMDPDAVGRITDSISSDGNQDFENQATAIGYDPQSPTIAVTDLSNDLSSSNTVDTDNDNDLDNHTALQLQHLTLTQTQIGDPQPSASGTVGNVDVTYELSLVNTGNEPLTTLSLQENFRSSFGGAFVGISSAPVVVSSTADDIPEINSSYDGETDSAIFDNAGANSNLIRTGQQVTLRLTVELDPNAPGSIRTPQGDFETQANLSAVGNQTGTVAQDLSDDPLNGTDVMLNADNLPDDPNRVRIPLISITKQVDGSPVPAASLTQGNFDVTYQIRIDNTGSTALESLSLIEDFSAHLGNAFVGISAAPTIIGGNASDPPEINSGYSGTAGNNELFDSSGTSRLESNEFLVLSITVELDPDASGRINDSVSNDGSGDFETQAIVSAIDPISLDIAVDRSDDPTDPTNVDGDPAFPLDLSDNDNDPDDPTAVWLPSITLTKTQIGAITPAESGTSGNFDVVYDLQLTNNGNEPLETLSLIEDLRSQFGTAFVRVVPQSGSVATIVSSSATDTPEINAGYTGDSTGSTDLFTNAGSNTNLLATGESVTVRLVIEFDADAPGANRTAGNFITSADVFGTGTDSSVVVTDRSDDPLVVAFVDIDSNNDPDDPNSIRVPDVTLTKEVVGTPSAAISGVVGNYDVQYELVVLNSGTTSLENLSVVDEWASQFGGAFIRIVPGSLSVSNINSGSPPGANLLYSGAPGENLLDGTGQIDSGESFRINVTVEVDPNAVGAIRQIGELVNQAVVTANDPAAPLIPITDLSDDPNDATNVDGDPTNPLDDDNNPDDPTGFGFTDIGLSKRILPSNVSATTPGAITLVYELVVRNVGSADLTNLTLTDDLTAGLGTAYTALVSPPSISGSTATANPNLIAGFDGNLAGTNNTAIFDGSSGLLRPTEEISVVFAVDVHPDLLLTTSFNQATAGGRDGIELVTDLSDTGTNPEDTNPGPQNDSGGEDDATLVPGIAITKDHGDPIRNSQNTSNWNVPITIRVVNTGSLQLTGLNLMEDIRSQFGSALISLTSPIISSVSVSSGDVPSINPNWPANTSLNLLAGGTLNPGDHFTIDFIATVDPDSQSNSVEIQNQSTISGFDTANPSIVVIDESDSGSAVGTNPGQPGDSGSVDDPTPLEIAEIGVAKRVSNVQMVGLTSLVTVEILVENTGTTHLRDLSLHDDLVTEFGDNFDAVVSPPQIISSTATATPTLNALYANDTTENLFAGTDGIMAPGEQIIVQMVVRVAATPGQASVVLTNQAIATGNATDSSGAPIRDQAGNPIGPVTDLSDSGFDAGSSNPSAPGDSGGSDDPTPTPITFFTFDNLNNFSEPFRVASADSDRDPRGNRLLTFEIPSLAPDPMFSGAARPGTKVIARVYDSNGFEIARESVFADTGGNWMMQIHEMERQDYVRVEFEEVSGNVDQFAPSGDPWGYLGADQNRNQYTALEPWAAYGHQYDFNAVYRGSARAALARAHQQASRPIGFGL